MSVSPEWKASVRAAGWVNQRATLRAGAFEARIEFKPKKANGHHQTHPWAVGLYRMSGEKTVGCYAPVARHFRTEREARAAARSWVFRRGAR